MRDYAQYSSRIPSPNSKRATNGSPAANTINTTSTTSTNGNDNKVTTTTTRNVTSHPLSSPAKTGGANNNNGYNTPPDKRESGSPTTTTPGSQTSNTNTTPRQEPYNSTPSTNPEIQQLREQLKEAMNRDATAKQALAKSDAVILELRSNQRQLKRQLEVLQQEKSEWSYQQKTSSGEQIDALKQQIQELTQQLQKRNGTSTALSKDAKVGELQIQLDRAHAQILTADMVRKELEDTLEAEQYTWELRVQDQERTIVDLQKECETLAQDLSQCRSQWKEAEVGWNEELEELRDQLTQAQARLREELSQKPPQQQEVDGTAAATSTPALLEKIHQLETERAELQSCLDEALKELEAVDAELQTDDNDDEKNTNKGKQQQQLVESLQHLLRWIYQEGPVEKRLNPSQLSSQTNLNELVLQIQEALELWLEATTDKQKQETDRSLADNTFDHESTITQLQNQMKAYQEELKSREESSSELRESLKEAVALLKPLQDAVAQVEEEKSKLQQQLVDIEQDRQSSQQEIVEQSKQIEQLEEQISTLQDQLEEQKQLAKARESLLLANTPSPHKSRSIPGSASPMGSPAGGSDDSLAKIKRAREELRRKRETEANLQHLLKDAQSRFKNLHHQNETVAAKNRELQGRIESIGVGSDQDQVGALSATLAQREAELQAMREQLGRMQRAMEDSSTSPNSSFQKVQSLEEELTKVRGELAQREQAERVLNKSLKEALGLLRPLQMHLEEAEAEKMEISKELRNLRKRFRQLQMGDGDDQSKSTMGGGGADVSVELIKIKDELEETVRQLELENSQLHDALEDLTEDGSNRHNEAKLRQRLVELNSRYEVTQNKLEDAHVENHALVKALKQKEMEDMNRKKEMMQLEQKLRHTETELHNAKAIAKSALVKVEELTMSSIEHLSRDGTSTIDSGVKVDGPGNKLSGYSF